MKKLLVLCLWCISTVLSAQQSPAPGSLESKVIFERTKAASVVVLSGEGAGRLESIATGVIISKDGLILTALHAIKGAVEVQVRTANGDVYDHVSLLGSDERRDVAALKVTATGLPFLATSPASSLTQGDPLYAVTNAGGLTWSATEGILSAIRPASEVTGAGSGYQLIQFTAPVAPGASGGALVDRTGALIGVITRGSGPAAFAVPIESVLGLPDLGGRITLGSGALLQLPQPSGGLNGAQSSAAIATADPKQILKTAKTVYIHSKTSFLTVDTLDRSLIMQKEWPSLNLTIVQDPRVADLLIEVDRPLFTYVHTFVVIDKRTSIVLASGKVTAFDGTIASGGLAKQIVKIFTQSRTAGAAK